MTGIAGLDIVIEWLVYLGRWGHVLAAITWVGTSFYFNWLDLSFRAPEGKTLKPNTVGQLHEVHGGSFYYHERHWPTEEPKRTHVHAGAAQLTFLTGIFLIAHIYWLGASVYLVESGPGNMGAGEAILVSVLILFAPWLAYDALCKTQDSERVVFWVMAALTVVISFAALQAFSPRAAFIHVGAALGTIMAANVQFMIIPNHIKMRQQVQRGEAVDQTYHKRAKRRSQHNNYFTLPVLFAMISSHFPLATANQYAWLILVMCMGCGVALRHRQNIRLAEDRTNNDLAIIAALLLAGAILLSAIPAQVETQDRNAMTAEEARVFDIVQTRCSVCHSATPSMEGFASAPGGIRFDTLGDIRARASVIRGQAVNSDLMPPGNMTEMTASERADLARWIQAQAGLSD